jgi:hypothetical protein
MAEVRMRRGIRRSAASLSASKAVEKRDVAPMSCGAGRALVVALLIAGIARGQAGSAAPAPPFPKKTAAEMTRIRDGAADVADVKIVVAAETAAGRTDSAAWWVAAFDATRKASKDGAPASEEIETLRDTTAAARALAAADKASALTALEWATAQVALRNFAEARRALATAEAAYAFRKDPPIETSLAEMRERLSNVDDKDADPAAVRAGRAAFDAARRAMKGRFRARLSTAAAQYKTAGCRPGREEIEAAIAAGLRAEVLGADEARKSRAETRLAGRRLERTRSVAVFVRTIGKSEFFLDGEPAAPLRPPKANDDEPEGPRLFALLPGDRLDVACDEPHATGESNFFVVTVHASVDGTPAAASSWRRNLAADPRTFEPVLKPAPVGRRRPATADDVDDEDPEFRDSVRKAGEVLETTPEADGTRPFIPIDEDVVRFERAFANRRLTPVWMAFLGRTCVLSFIVPERTGG